MSGCDRESQLSALVQDDQVHRDLYLDPRIFHLEMRRLWRRAWIFAGHLDEQRNPVVPAQRMIGDCSVRLSFDASGAPCLIECISGRTLPHVTVCQGFIFARLADEGEDLDTFLGPMARVLETITCRSPVRRFELAGPPLRTLVRANWKIYLENINDALHPVSTHASASEAALCVAQDLPAGTATPMALQQLLPFAGGYGFFDALGGRLLARGHTLLGTRDSIHTGYAQVTGYEQALQQAFGAARAREVLAFAPQNAVIYPSLALKATPQVLRVLRPLAVDRTVVEAWSFQAAQAPETLGQRGVLYNRLAFSPMSVVALDDQHLFEGIHQGLRARTNPWVSLHRGAHAQDTVDVSGTDEALLRHQYLAWREGMMCAVTPS